MKIVFLSNCLNHHQKPLSNELYATLGDNYHFIATSEINEERKKFAVQEENATYLLKYSMEPDLCNKIIEDSDIVLFGDAPYTLVKKRIYDGKITIRVSERPLKKGIELLKYLPRLIKWRNQFPQNKQVYLLCASAYSYADYQKFGMFKNRAFKWGYFPAIITYENIENMIHKKKKNSLIWVARFIHLKHPEYVIELAKRLKQDGYDFEINMIGNGVLLNEISEQIIYNKLEDCVKLLGAMPPEKVREHMEQSEIFLFTSDRNEGWGVVLNEAMNSACASVASHATGSTPYLITHQENGLIYKSGDLEDLYLKVKQLLDNKEERCKLSQNAYYTILNQWAPKHATQRLIKLCEAIIKKDDTMIFDDGVCSISEIY